MLSGIIIILNLVLLEIVLSIDNAAVLSTMVNDLPKKQHKKALTYGIFGAYVFRGLALLFAVYLIQLEWLKLLGGAYLIYLCISSLLKSDNPQAKKFKIPFLNQFWSTVVMIEFVDIVFSIDNIFSAVAFTDNYLLICIGVFVGILAIRFATIKLINLLNKVPNLERIAFLVIGVLGIKLCLSVFLPQLNSEHIDLLFSGVTLLAFVLPFVLMKFRKS
jgi:YkoY family integral membrane protein